ncbi:MAG: hypothetical protein DMG55_28905 [Acidobacteria bacterium]|nr:MAG: hypothetical protein DMG55_28905 [Acidobacteriota bacterium]
MNGTGAWSRLEQKLFDGRIEKRLPASVPVYLASLKEPRSGEQTTTENISPHGARTISKRLWRAGETALVAPLTGEFTQVGRVVYCEQKTEGRFCLGLEFLARSVNWGNDSRT